MRSTTVSVVLYGSKLYEVDALLHLLSSNSSIEKWVIVDNGSSDDIQQAVIKLGGIYIRSKKNVGFGSGHNIALRYLSDVHAPYHLILNPDVMFPVDTLEKLSHVMEEFEDVGLVMPQVVYPDGSNQYLCKLLPSPVDLLLRRFAPKFICRLFKSRISTFDLRFFDYTTPAYIPYLSGCFMFIRRGILNSIQGFDERFFLYMEDLDMCRRIATLSKLLYWPRVQIVHEHQKASYKKLRILILHLAAAVKYFNKWGWFFDDTRKKVNRDTLVNLSFPVNKQD